MNIDFQSTLSSLIQNNPYYQDVHSLLVSHKGKLLFEGYFHGYTAQTLHEAQSVTKSIQSLLVGIALDKKFIPHLDVKIKDYFPQYKHLDWSNGKDAITLRHLLTMTAGLEWNEGDIPYTRIHENHANLQFMAYDWVEYALAMPMKHKPGAQFAYSSASPILISHILRAATGLPNELFALHYFYMPLGITRFEYQKGQHDAEILADVDLLPADLLKIGQLVMQKGRFNGVQVVPEAWVGECLKAHISLPDGKGYGYMWWSDAISLWTKETIPHQYAWGYGGQHIFMLPTHDLLVVTTGGHYQRDVVLAKQPFQLLISHILPHISA